MTMKLEYYEGSATVSRARSSNVATIVMNDNHNLITGDTVTITGLGGTGYNDSNVSITVTNSFTFTYANTGSDEVTTGDTAGEVRANFTLPHNSKTFDDELQNFLDQKDFAYAFTYFGLTNSIKSRRSLVAVGHFDGTTKMTDYQNLVKFANSVKIIKFYFTSSKFFIGFMSKPKRTHSGGKTNFVDYVFSFISPFGLLLDDTQQSGDNTSAVANDGNIPTPIEEITGTVVATQLVTIKDKDGNGFTFTASHTGTLTVKLITLIDIGSDNFFTSYIYASIGGNKQSLSIATNNKSMLLRLDVGEDLNNRFNTGSAAVTNLTSPVFKFRPGYSADA